MITLLVILSPTPECAIIDVCMIATDLMFHGYYDQKEDLFKENLLSQGGIPCYLMRR
jgi:hypothetical protein